jgi:hypothetical protein
MKYSFLDGSSTCVLHRMGAVYRLGMSKLHFHSPNVLMVWTATIIPFTLPSLNCCNVKAKPDSDNRDYTTELYTFLRSSL